MAGDEPDSSGKSWKEKWNSLSERGSMLTKDVGKLLSEKGKRISEASLDAASQAKDSLEEARQRRLLEEGGATVADRKIIEEALSLEMIPTSLPHLEDAFRIVSKMGTDSEETVDSFVTIVSRIGRIYDEMGREERAIHYYEKLYNYGIGTNNLTRMDLALSLQAGVFTKNGDIANLRRICELHDSMGVDDDYLWSNWKQIVSMESEVRRLEAQNSSGCFIATAAFGTPFDPKIDVLRSWRDTSLQQSIFGRFFIRFYYSISPPIASVISKSKFLRWFVRGMLSPIVLLLEPNYGMIERQ